MISHVQLPWGGYLVTQLLTWEINRAKSFKSVFRDEPKSKFNFLWSLDHIRMRLQLLAFHKATVTGKAAEF